MANPYFQFKKFTVWHEKCAMKVGTDGVLLGAWTNILNAHYVLDIGTGTGLIALMLAQRCGAVIDAIDIDKDACEQAKENVAASPFNKQIHVYHTPLAEYIPLEGRRYNLIVSNPPYFVNSLKCPDKKRQTARHTDTLPLSELLQKCRQLLTTDGRLALILPYEQKERLLELSQEAYFYLLRETDVCPTPKSQPKRVLVELAVQPVEHPQSNLLTIEQERHRYTEEFQAMVRDFYLKL